jgi:hypothetical protein
MTPLVYRCPACRQALPRPDAPTAQDVVERLLRDFPDLDEMLGAEDELGKKAADLLALARAVTARAPGGPLW